MKINKFFMGILGALALTACSNDDIAPDTPVLPDEGESRYMSVTIRNSDAASSRAGDETTDYEAGLTKENNVKSLRFYFFDENGKAAAVQYNGRNYYDCKEDEIIPNDPSAGMPNVESILNAVIVINTNTSEASRSDIKQMVAVVNFDKVGLGDVNLNLAELTEKVVEENVAKDDQSGFLMTSSAFYGNDGYGLAVAIKDTDIKSTKELAMAYPVDVYVERVVAKVRVKASWSIPTKEVTFNGEKYTAVELKDKNGSNIRVGNGDDSPIAYVIFKNWDLWWTTDKTNLFKKVGDWSGNLGTWWIDNNGYHRSYWAENPDGVKLSKHNHIYPSRLIGYDDKDYEKYTAYCLENAADYNNGGLKKTYNPDKETSNRTLVYLAAKIVTVGDDNVAEVADIAEWAGYKYTKADVLKAMFVPNQNEFYFLHKEDITNLPEIDANGNVIESGEINYTYIPLKDSDIELVSGLMAGVAGEQKENDVRYLSFLNLKKNLWGKKMTEDGKELEVVHQLYRKTMEMKDGKPVFAAVTIDEVNNQLESVGGAKVWDMGDTYYYHEINHLGKTGVDAAQNPYKYGVVRNHIYEIELNSVTGLGTPVLNYKDEEGDDYWENIIPQKPTPDSYFLGARLNILSWRVVSNGVSLDW